MIYSIALVKKITTDSIDFNNENLYETIFTFDKYEPAIEKLKQYRDGYERTLSDDYAGIVMFSSASPKYQVTFIQNDASGTRVGYNVWYKNTTTNLSPHWDIQPYEVAKKAVDTFNDSEYNETYNPMNRVRAVCFPTT